MSAPGLLRVLARATVSRCIKGVIAQYNDISQIDCSRLPTRPFFILRHVVDNYFEKVLLFSCCGFEHGKRGS
jgi:hypothetical protein